ncbi:MAG TPA: hypothetical protein P5531_08455 [Bacteroidales bacterium]|nr:hypothetical protein [Bacteroidales bacterium]HSA43558.1 hypothetical protein [Bacteroidales bacterium]
MKPHSILLLLPCMLLLPAPVNAQTHWTKHNGNPVFSPQGSQYENVGIGQPTCLFEDDTIKMWYASVGNDMKARILLAFSTDAINWIRYNNALPVLDVGQAGSWDQGWLDTPEIVKDGQGYKLYYYGDTVQQVPEISSAIGAAWSPNGLNWTRYAGNPVLTEGDSLQFDGKWVESPAAIYDADSQGYYIWYSGMNWNWFVRNGLATSDDAFTLTKYPANPVTPCGLTGSFDDMWVAVPAVIKTGPVFEMWYSGFSSLFGFDNVQIGYAVSLDGIRWIKYPANPVYNRFFPPFDTAVDSHSPWAPDVVWHTGDQQYYMLYEGTGGIHLATSPRNVLDAPQCNVQVCPNTTHALTDSAQLWATGGQYYQWNPRSGLSNPDIWNPKVHLDPGGPLTQTYTVLIVSDSCVTTRQVQVTVEPFGLEEGEERLSFVKLFPNPADDRLMLTIAAGMLPAKWALSDPCGRECRRGLVSQISTRIETGGLSGGVYYFSIESRQGRFVRKIVLQ